MVARFVVVYCKSLESCHQSPKRGRLKVHMSSPYVLMIDDNSTCYLTGCMSFRTMVDVAIGEQVQGLMRLGALLGGACVACRSSV